ncbi:hypothetical protein ACO0RG_002107 [Hanseniaspora osmophila]
MSDPVSLLTLADCVSKGDVESTKKLLFTIPHINTRFCKCIAVLWPEYSAPDSLKFMGTYYGKLDLDSTTESQLIQASTAEEIELDSYLDSQLRLFLGFQNSAAMDFSTVDHFFRARVLVVNMALPNDPLYCLPLAKSLNISNEPWITGILKPFYYFKKTKTLENLNLVKNFQEAAPEDIISEMFEHFLKTSGEVKMHIMNRQIKPYIDYMQLTDLFIEKYLKSNDFHMDYSTAFFLLQHPITDGQTLNEKYYQTLIERIWNTSDDFSISELRSCVQSLPENTVIQTLLGTLGKKTLLEYLNVMEELKFNNFQKIVDLSKNANNIQPVYFTFLCDQYFAASLKKTSSSTCLPWFFESPLFDSLDTKKKHLLITESLIKNNKLEELKTFSQEQEIDHDFLLNHFWKLFHKASNGLPKNSNMKQCYSLLSMLNDEKLTLLLDLVQYLAVEFPSFQLVPNQPFKPSHILQLSNSPLLLIDKLFNANENQYLHPEETVQLLKKLFTVLDVVNIDDAHLQSKVLASSIEIALVKNNFNFAYSLTIQLLENKNACNYWFVILQVGKFIDANHWPDLETPTEIIFLQMEILSKLLIVIPPDDMESAVSEYSRLELELSTRNLINDEYSLENKQRFNNTKSYENFLSSFKSNVSNLLKE